ncbi:MAG TPA: glycosyltransferase [Saprospiraceae bacterium]|nr:glycosyltransferase [Saprospiraceae bacterium]
MSSIVIIGPAHPLRGGLASFDERLAREFQAQGFKTTIYTFSLQYPSFLFPGTTQYSDEPAPKDLSIKVKINSVNPFNWIRIGRELKTLKPDLVIVRYWLPFMGPCLGTILRIVQKNKHSKIICIADNVIPHEKRPGDRQFTRYFLNSADAFITMSEKVNADLQLFSSSKPNMTLDHPLYDNFGEQVEQAKAREFLHIPQADSIILFFGFIRKYKGLDLLLEAMSTEPLKSSGIRLLIAGEFYEDSKPYMEMIESDQIQDQIILRTHFISDSEVKYYLSACDLVVQPYRNATQSGVTPLAYHFNKPMVVTNVGSLPRLVPHGEVGLVCEPNPKDLAETIVAFFNQNQQMFIQNIQEKKKKLSWSHFVERIQSLSNDIQK